MLTLPQKWKANQVLQNGDILKIMTAGKLLHFAQPFSDFDGFLVFTLLVQPCWPMNLVGFIGSSVCKLGEPICFSNCFNWKRFSMLWHWSRLFVNQKLGQYVSGNLTWNLPSYYQSMFVYLLDTVTPFLRRGIARWTCLTWSLLPSGVQSCSVIQTCMNAESRAGSCQGRNLRRGPRLLSVLLKFICAGTSVRAGHSLLSV